jgi:translation initiation factor 3 subunit M
MSQVVFATNSSLSFVAGLARWVSPPTEPQATAADSAAAAADGEAAAVPTPSATAPEVQPSEYELECIALESKGDLKQLGERLITALKERLSSAAEGEVEVAYTVLLQLLLKWELLEGSLLQLANELASSIDDRPLLRRKVLLTLFSVVNQHGFVELRFPLLTLLLSFCARAGCLEELLGGPAKRVATVEGWIDSWKLSDAQMKELWGLVFDAHVDDATATYENAMKYLPLHTAADLSSDEKLRERLVRAALVTLRSPGLPTCDKLAQLPVVAALASDKQYAPLSRLLNIFAREMYSSYLAFYSEDTAQAFMKEHGLQHEACERKMRLLSLTSLCVTHKELTYAAVAEALKVEADQAEHWVVEAISAGLIAAKMDQVRSTVVVSSCLEREFGTEQFGRLRTSLSQWGTSVHGLLKVVLESKAAP